jgi:hypothetical protein
MNHFSWFELHVILGRLMLKYFLTIHLIHLSQQWNNFKSYKYASTESCPKHETFLRVNKCRSSRKNRDQSWSTSTVSAKAFNSWIIKKQSPTTNNLLLLDIKQFMTKNFCLDNNLELKKTFILNYRRLYKQLICCFLSHMATIKLFWYMKICV